MRSAARDMPAGLHSQRSRPQRLAKRDVGLGVAEDSWRGGTAGWGSLPRVALKMTDCSGGAPAHATQPREKRGWLRLPPVRPALDQRRTSCCTAQRMPVDDDIVVRLVVAWYQRTHNTAGTTACQRTHRRSFSGKNGLASTTRATHKQALSRVFRKHGLPA